MILSRNRMLPLLVAVLITACTTTAPDAAPPVAAESAAIRELVDPQLGFTGTAADPKTPARYSRAVRYLAEGRLGEAEKRLIEIVERDPAYTPAALLLARLAIERGEYDRAGGLIDRARVGTPSYLAADIYDAELAFARGDRERAYEIYTQLASNPELPAISRARYDQLRGERFASLVQRAGSEGGDAAVATLREALALRDDEPVRLTLVRALIAAERYDDARRELEPVLTNAADRDDVQEILAELDLARGRYQEAIFRLERLQRRAPSERHVQRLNEAKRLWSEANMPPQYRSALESDSINRADFAVLLFWKVSAVRFATSVRQPPIAVDVAQVPGREELVRAMALGLFPVDPVTRTVDPYRTVTPAVFSRLLGRVLSLRGPLPQCASTVAESNETLRGQKMLELCGIDVGPLRNGDAVPGEYAADVLAQVDTLLASAK